MPGYQLHTPSCERFANGRDVESGCCLSGDTHCSTFELVAWAMLEASTITLPDDPERNVPLLAISMLVRTTPKQEKSPAKQIQTVRMYRASLSGHYLLHEQGRKPRSSWTR